MTCLYYRVMHFRPAEPDWPERDRFLLSKGHAAPALYAILIDLGVLPREAARSLRQLGSPLQGHPDRRFTRGLEISSGSLGQGLSMGVGLALGFRRSGRIARVFVLLGDGECQEGQVWEAALSAAQLRLGRLCAIVDYNGLQHDGPVAQIGDLAPLAAKWVAFGWEALEVDGHDHGAIVAALERPMEAEARPRVIVARTIKGKGVAFMEHDVAWHGCKDPDTLRQYVAARLAEENRSCVRPSSARS